MGCDAIPRKAAGLLLIGIAISAAGAPARGQGPGGVVGGRVVLRAGAEIRIGDVAVDTRKVHCIFTAERVDRDSVWVVSGGVRGWVKAADVVPYGQAIEYYTDEIRSHPDAAWAYNRRGFIRDEQGAHDRALADYDEAIRIDPDLALAYNNRGLARAHKGEYDKAIADYGRAIRLDPRDALPYTNRARAWSMKHDYGQALADLDRAVAADPKYFNAYNGRAWLLATCPDAAYRDGPKAVESATRACELEVWSNAYCLGTLATAYAEAGDFDRAVHWQARANTLYTSRADQAEGRARLALFREGKPFRMTK